MTAMTQENFLEIDLDRFHPYGFGQLVVTDHDLLFRPPNKSQPHPEAGFDTAHVFELLTLADLDESPRPIRIATDLDGPEARVHLEKAMRLFAEMHTVLRFPIIEAAVYAGVNGNPIGDVPSISGLRECLPFRIFTRDFWDTGHPQNGNWAPLLAELDLVGFDASQHIFVEDLPEALSRHADRKSPVVLITPESNKHGLKATLYGVDPNVNYD